MDELTKIPISQTYIIYQFGQNKNLESHLNLDRLDHPSYSHLVCSVLLSAACCQSSLVVVVVLGSAEC